MSYVCMSYRLQFYGDCDGHYERVFVVCACAYDLHTHGVHAHDLHSHDMHSHDLFAPQLCDSDAGSDADFNYDYNCDANSHV